MVIAFTIPCPQALLLYEISGLVTSLKELLTNPLIFDQARFKRRDSEPTSNVYAL